MPEKHEVVLNVVNQKYILGIFIEDITIHGISVLCITSILYLKSTSFF